MRRSPMFKIEIEGLDDFIRFVKFIRNEPITDEEVQLLSTRLATATTELKKAEDNAGRE